jgi:hypothetical protein
MRRLVSQPRNVRYGIPRRMRAQHQTTMAVHVRKSNRGMNNQSINKQAKQQKLVVLLVLVLLDVVHYNNKSSLMLFIITTKAP